MKTKVCICGGGNLATVCAGFLAAQETVAVSLLTRKPQAWASEVEVIDPDGRCFRSQLQRISDRPEDVVPQADLVLLCLPGFGIEPTLMAIKPYLSSTTAVGSVVSSTGFFFFAHKHLPARQPLFGFQRVPFIARTEVYGHRAHLLGYKKELSVAFENDSVGSLRLENLFRTPIRRLNNFYEASLTNSNPILHTGRLFTLWHDWNGEAIATPIRFYEEWTDEASACILAMDDELMSLTRKLGIDEQAVPSLLTYYESTDAPSLTRKIRSIAAFQGILAPMCQTSAGYVPDFNSRYFIEDFPFGLRFIRQLLHEHELPCPHVDEVYAWGMQKVRS